ncbi:unnamed protein product [Trichobilharzia regenti]|nr:unnamed protein product [Trichobilharzia regenti]
MKEGWTSSGLPSNMSDLIPADGNCTDGIHWIWISMGQCVMDARGGVALFCGFVCLLLWIAVGIPQIVENFRTGIPDKALSPGFLVLWTSGDVCNLIGCFLTHQLIMQVRSNTFFITDVDAPLKPLLSQSLTLFCNCVIIIS